VNPRLKRAWHVPDAGDQDENPAWKPKLKDWQPAIEDYLCGWDLSDADIDTVLLRCQVDPVFRGEYLRLEASVGGAGWHRLMAECRPPSVGWGGQQENNGLTTHDVS
jgi:hypothetical protein